MTNTVDQEAESVSTPVVPYYLLPAVAGASFTVVQTKGTARPPPCRSGLIPVSRSSKIVLHGALPVSPASETEQHIRQKDGIDVRQFSAQNSGILQHETFLILIKSVFGHEFLCIMNVANMKIDLIIDNNLVLSRPLARYSML